MGHLQRRKMMTEGTISIFLCLFRSLIYTTVVIKTVLVAQLWKKDSWRTVRSLYLYFISFWPWLFGRWSLLRSNPEENVLKIWVWVTQKGKQVKSLDPTLNFLGLACCLGSGAWFWSILINRADKHNLVNSSCICKWNKEKSSSISISSEDANLRLRRIKYLEAYFKNNRRFIIFL